jgi:hypothetical protein
MNELLKGIIRLLMESQDVKDRKSIPICQSGNSDRKNSLLRKNRSCKKSLIPLIHESEAGSNRFRRAFISGKNQLDANSEGVLL